MTRFARLSLLTVMLAAFWMGPGWRVPAVLAADRTVRIAILQFGTVSWEVDVVKRRGLDRQHGIDLDVNKIAGKQAADVMLLSGDTDVIVSDWIWVSRQRSQGRKLAFIPYSRAVGALMVPPQSPIKSLADLAGRKIGVAGGPTDKSWIILQALAQKRHGIELAKVAEPSFGAPPLLNELAQRGNLDAIVNYWHYLAKLEAKGFTPLITVDEATEALGLNKELPLLGYVFFEDWARANPQAIEGLAAASAEAKDILKTSDAEWEKLKPLMRAEDQATFIALREGFRAGIPERIAPPDLKSAHAMYALMAQLGGRDLVGDSKELADGVFYRIK